MDPERLIPRSIFRFDVVDSTNEKAKEMLDQGMEEGVVILASRQASGRGRHGRAWASPPGGLYMSIVLKPKKSGIHLHFPPDGPPALRAPRPIMNIQLLSLLSGLPVVRTLRRLGIEASLKWPNDVLIHGLKVCGILCEGVYRRDAYWVIVGIGLNVGVDLRRLPKDVQSSATSLRRELEGDVDPESVLVDLLQDYDDFYAVYVGEEKERLLKEYREMCETLGKSVVIETAKGRMSGRAIDISGAGALVLDSGGKRTEIFEGTLVKTT